MTAESLGAEMRRSRLRELMAADGTLDLAHAADVCGVSEMTIRRDLLKLERDGLVRRVRGGAVAVVGERFERRAARNNTAKQRIAAKLLTLVPEQGFVALDSSSTVHHLAGALAGDLTVLTTGLETFGVLRGRVKRVVLSGGELEEATDAFVGPVALRTIDDFHFTRTFLGAAGLDPDRGAMDSTLENAEVKRALRRASAFVVVAADASKLDRPGPAAALRLSDVDLLVTDLDPADPRLDAYRERVDLL